MAEKQGVLYVAYNLATVPDLGAVLGRLFRGLEVGAQQELKRNIVVCEDAGRSHQHRLPDGVYVAKQSEAGLHPGGAVRSSGQCKVTRLRTPPRRKRVPETLVEIWRPAAAKREVARIAFEEPKKARQRSCDESGVTKTRMKENQVCGSPPRKSSKVIANEAEMKYQVVPNWKCLRPSCRFTNFGFRQECKSCSAMAPWVSLLLEDLQAAERVGDQQTIQPLEHHMQMQEIMLQQPADQKSNLDMMLHTTEMGSDLDEVLEDDADLLELEKQRHLLSIVFRAWAGELKDKKNKGKKDNKGKGRRGASGASGGTHRKAKAKEKDEAPEAITDENLVSMMAQVLRLLDSGAPQEVK
ncbi:unnamed protein product, partial [Prorocentrum cordatum]